jgi:hypothetical protein
MSDKPELISSNPSLSAQERHFADQIDGLLERVNLLEKFLGGRWHVADAARATPETGCGLCAMGMNSFIDPDTGNRMHARNGTVTLCCALKAPERHPFSSHSATEDMLDREASSENGLPQQSETK